MKKKREIERFVCPEVRNPDSFTHSGEDRPYHSNSSSSLGGNSDRGKIRGIDSITNGRNSSKADILERKKEREVFAGYFDDVKTLGKSTLTGIAKKQYNSNKLTALGAYAEKAQRMPFKMQMGLMQGRKKREQRTKDEAKSAGTILAKGTSSSSSSAAANQRKRYDGPSIDIGTRGGIAHLSSKRLPGKLLNKSMKGSSNSKSRK